MLETAIVVDIGVHLVKGTYALDGDEALALTCFDRISTIRTLSSELTSQKQLLIMPVIV